VGLNPAPEAKNTPNIIALQKDSQAIAKMIDR